MSDKAEEYRQHVIHCRNMADVERSVVMKANWLDLAEKWLGMIQDERRSAALSAVLQAVSVEIKRSDKRQPTGPFGVTASEACREFRLKRDDVARNRGLRWRISKVGSEGRYLLQSADIGSVKRFWVER
jgi:hypothetical protein